MKTQPIISDSEARDIVRAVDTAVAQFTAKRYIASRPWSKQVPVFYVQNIKGRVGDWGYTTEPAKALPLTIGQRVRFAADCRACGVVATFTEVQS